MKHSTTYRPSADRLNIFIQSWEPEHVKPKAVICLVHGLGEHSGRYAHVAESLNRQGYILCAIDLRGHGRSGGKRGHFSSIEYVLNDIDLLLAHADVTYPGLPIFLYGHSLGGILTLYYILRRKPFLSPPSPTAQPVLSLKEKLAVKGVMVTSPGLVTAIEKQPFKVMAAKILGSVLPSVQLPSGLDANALSHDAELVKTYKNDPLVHDKISLGFGKIMLAVNRWTMQQAHEFSQPLLLMHGTGDAIAYPEGSINFAAALPNNCKLVLWKNAWHELHNEYEKEAVLTTMITWLDEIMQKP